MSREDSFLNSLVSHFFIEKMLFSSFASFKAKFFLKKYQNMLFARCSNYLNKENSDSMKVFSGLAITLYRISSEVKFCPCLSTGGEIKPGWNFSSGRTCENLQKIPHRQGKFHTRAKCHMWYEPLNKLYWKIVNFQKSIIEEYIQARDWTAQKVEFPLRIFLYFMCSIENLWEILD